MKKTKKKIIKKVNKSKDVFYFYNIRPFHSPIIFFYSDSPSNLAKHLNKKKNKKISDWLKKHCNELPVMGGLEDGFLSYNLETKRPLILFIKRQSNREQDRNDILVHEITHLVQHLEQYFGFNDEEEFRAYLTVSILKDLRKLM